MALSPAIFGSNNNPLSGIEENINSLNDALNPFTNAGQNGQVPFYVTGGRALLKVGGKPIGVAQKIRWNIDYTSTPINTIDASHAWDIDVGQARIVAELGQVMDPTKGPEHDGIFHIMQAAIHQPLVEMQIIDRAFGTQYFFAKGMFVGVSGGVQVGQVGNWQAKFVGVAYQHYVNQGFKPYTGVAGAAGTLIDGLQNISSDLTGGIL